MMFPSHIVIIRVSKVRRCILAELDGGEKIEDGRWKMREISPHLDIRSRWGKALTYISPHGSLQNERVSRMKPCNRTRINVLALVLELSYYSTLSGG